MNIVSTYGDLKLKELEAKKVTNKAAARDKENTKNEKVESIKNKVTSVKPPSSFPQRLKR